MTEANVFEPSWLSPPGDTIEDILESKGWSKRELAQRTGYSEKHISQLTTGDASLSEDAALRLESVLGGTARFWLAREAQYREAVARVAAREDLEAQRPWLKELPLTDMRRWGLISKTRDKIEQVRECLQFFGVANVNAWRAQYASPLAAFRASGRSKLEPGSVATWMRQAEREAEKLDCRPWDREAFEREVRSLRSLTLKTATEEFMPELISRCAACGVAVVVTPAPEGCPAFGMTKWLTPHKALLALSLRYKTHDQLWFSFFHEAGHLLLHGKRLVIIEGLKGLDEQLEDEANAFARDVLIPPDAGEKLPALTKNLTAIRQFAADLGVHPGIVVGRMQHDRLLGFDQRNQLKVRYQFAH